MLERLARGERVAYVSDAGTPAVSATRARRWSRRCAAPGYRVRADPRRQQRGGGASVAGDAASGGFRFVGFLPARGAERAARARSALAHAPHAQVLFEAPHRIDALAARAGRGVRRRGRVTLCRELTKQFETVVTLPARELPAWLAADANRTRGEFVLVLHAPAAAGRRRAPTSRPQTRRSRVLLRRAAAEAGGALAATLSGAPRNALYARALQRRCSGRALSSARTDRSRADAQASRFCAVVLLACRCSRLALFCVCVQALALLRR